MNEPKRCEPIPCPPYVDSVVPADPLDPLDDANQLAEHIVECRGVSAAVVMDGSADEVVEMLLAAGWTYDELGAETFGLKRIRYLRPPAVRES